MGKKNRNKAHIASDTTHPKVQSAHGPISNSPIALQQAAFEYQMGNWAVAEKICISILSNRALHSKLDLFDALNLLGIIAIRTGHDSEALDFMAQAVQTNPHEISAHLNLGHILRRQNKPAQAAQCYAKAISLDPNHAEAHHGLGLALAKAGNQEAAISSQTRAIHLDPRHAAAHNNRGIAHVNLENYAAGLNDFDIAIQLKPDYAEAHDNRGAVLTSLKRYNEALESHDRALQIKIDFASAHYNRGLALSKLHHHSTALESYGRAIAIKPDYATAHFNQAATFADLKNYEVALKSYERAIELEPNYAEAHQNLGLLCLALGDFQRGWKEYEWRWLTAKMSRQKLNTKKPLWTGDQSNKRLLFWAEQGLGDQILYGSILQSLLDFPQKKMVTIDHRLVPLFQRSIPEIEFSSIEDSFGEDQFDQHLPIGSLGRLLRSSAESFITAKQPVFKANPALSSELRSKIKKPGKLICGISWFSASETGDAKSLRLTDLLPILSMPDVEFVDLQYGDTADERNAIKQIYNIEIKKLEEIDNYNDIDGLTSLIDACDLVITVSNTTAHLAGVIGKETLLLTANGHQKLWYWHEISGKCLWYPSIRLFEQTRAGDWSHVLNNLKKYLEIKITKAAPNF